jgi:hypothetical protein
VSEPALLEILPPPGADIARMPVGSGIAGLAVCGAFDGLGEALGEIARVLAPGGRLCGSMAQPVQLEERRGAWRRRAS